MKLRKILAILLTGLTIMSCAVTAFAAESAAYIEAGYDTLRIDENGYTLDDGTTKTTVPHTGSYVLYGAAYRGIHFDKGTYDVTVHDLSLISSYNYSAFTLENGSVINLTVIGKNEFSGYNHAGITLNGDIDSTVLTQVFLDMTDNSELIVCNQVIQYGSSVREGIDILMKDGQTVPGTEIEGWRSAPLTITNGTAVSHNTVYTESGDGHIYDCGDCDLFENNTSIGKHRNKVGYTSIDDKTHVLEGCMLCNAGGIIEAHNMAYFNRNSETCYYECDRCYFTPVENGYVPHVFEEIVLVEETETEAEHILNLCKNCGTYKKDYNKEKAIEIEITNLLLDYYNGNAFAILVYTDGEPTHVLRGDGYEDLTNRYIPYNDDSSYVFKIVNYTEAPDEFTAKITLPDGTVLADIQDFSTYSVMSTLAAFNVADYTQLDAALASVPQEFESYTQESVEKLVSALKTVKPMLSKGEQEAVDTMTAAVNEAVEGLEIADELTAHGVINLYYNLADIADGGYTVAEPSNVDAAKKYAYDGNYVLVDTRPLGDDERTDTAITFSGGEYAVDLVNAYNTATEYIPFTVNENTTVTMTLYGNNAMAECAENATSSGIFVHPDGKLIIAESDGNIVAVGGKYCAGIGGTDTGGLKSCGEVTIEGGRIFAISVYDGAGIGGAEDGGAGTITINGGTIHAECLEEDGAGIGSGNDGSGGDIIINGGNITALSLDSEGAGIGSGEDYEIDSITINGGYMVVGSASGAGVGAGDDNAYAGKIIINGGTIVAHEDHDSFYEMLIGEQDPFDPAYPDDSCGETDYNFVQINGGIIADYCWNSIYPTPKREDGTVLYRAEIAVDKIYHGKVITFELSDGTTVQTIPHSTRATAYIPEEVTVTNEAEFHTFKETLTQGEDTHYYECENCTLVRKDEVPHSFDAVSNGDGTHSSKCICGFVENTESCTGGAATCNEKAVCKICEKPYGEIDNDNHSFSDTLTIGKNTHYYLCAGCGEKNGEVPHSYENYESNGNDTHTGTCVCGDTHTEKCAGGAADCENAAICKVCAAEYGKKLGHDMGKWTDCADGENHERACLRDGCGKTEVEKHRFSVWFYNDDSGVFDNGTQSRSCSICGLTETVEVENTSLMYRVFGGIINFFAMLIMSLLNIFAGFRFNN